MPTIRSISPLQAAMLRGSLVRATGENVEQVEIDFTPGVSMTHVTSAWIATVDGTAALRSSFVFADGEPSGVMPMEVNAPIHTEQNIPESWQTWLASDRFFPPPTGDWPARSNH